MTKFEIFNEDCLARLATLGDNTVDSIITDPPYGLSDHREDYVRECLEAWAQGLEWSSPSKGFMNKAWDAWVPGPEVWRECNRVLKPGGHLLVFSSPRSQDLMGIAVRLAGLQIRDSIAWVYSSGMPKSLNAATRFKDPELAERFAGWGSALAPSCEPILVARKRFDGTIEENMRDWGVGLYNIEACRVGSVGGTKKGAFKRRTESAVVYGEGLNGDAGKEDIGKGRWPKNLIHDGEAETVRAFPDAPGQLARSSTKAGNKSPLTYRARACESNGDAPRHDEETSAARMYYCAKASKSDCDEGLEDFAVHSAAELTERTEGSAGINAYAGPRGPKKNFHPTKKPTDLMRYLCRLVTPAGGTVLDPFMGSGSTGKAAVLEGFRFIGVERDPAYFKLAVARLEHASKVSSGSES